MYTIQALGRKVEQVSPLTLARKQETVAIGTEEDRVAAVRKAKRYIKKNLGHIVNGMVIQVVEVLDARGYTIWG